MILFLIYQDLTTIFSKKKQGPHLTNHVRSLIPKNQKTKQLKAGAVTQKTLKNEKKKLTATDRPTNQPIDRPTDRHSGL